MPLPPTPKVKTCWPTAATALPRPEPSPMTSPTSIRITAQNPAGNRATNCARRAGSESGGESCAGESGVAAVAGIFDELE